MYGLNNLKADYFGNNINCTLNGISMLINDCHIDTQITGLFNVYNLLAIFSVSRELIDYKIESPSFMNNLKSVPGRFDVINSTQGIIGIIDYAHSPDALEKVFSSINHLRGNEQKIISVLGCGGNRDIGKRPIMGKITYLHSNISIFTSDNPRYEKLDKIISDMKLDIIKEINRELFCIHDRKEAIVKASTLAQKGDIILILGKGHEDYQEIEGEKKPFDDYKVLTKILQ
tara:strand:- start:491 stop:1180 length:690 start_codon:yes stop_codon:yes gene_type:complete